MEEKNCPKCGNLMELVPAGVSKKSGKKYGAFWSCNPRKGGCGTTAFVEDKKAPAGEYKDVDGEILAKLTRIENKLSDIERAVNFKHD